MKKIVTVILLLCVVLTFAACADKKNTPPEITMQEIYDACRVEAMLQNHQSVYLWEEWDGEVFDEKYLTKEYAYEHFPDEEFDWAQFMTDDTNYAYSGGDYLRYLFVAPDGVTNDFASDRAERYVSVLDPTIVNETIESVSKKDGRITVKSFLGEEALAEMAAALLAAQELVHACR